MLLRKQPGWFVTGMVINYIKLFANNMYLAMTTTFSDTNLNNNKSDRDLIHKGHCSIVGKLHYFVS